MGTGILTDLVEKLAGRFVSRKFQCWDVSFSLVMPIINQVLSGCARYVVSVVSLLSDNGDVRDRRLILSSDESS